MKILLVILATLGLAGPSFALPANPVALYTFDVGSAWDSSGNGNHGTLLSGVSFGAGHGGSGQAAEFVPVAGLSGIDTGVNIAPGDYAGLTMGAWVFAASTGGIPGGKVLSHDDGGFDRTLGFDTRGASPGKNMAAFSGAGVADIDGADAGLSGWIHYAVRYDGATSAIFKNGALVETFSDATGPSTSSLHLGTNPGFDEDFTGLIDDVFVFGYGLSATQVQDIYLNGISARVPIPASLWMLVLALGSLGAIWRRRVCAPDGAP